MFSVHRVGVIYPEFRSRTPPPTYNASVMEYEDRRRPRRLSCEDVATFPNMSLSEAIEPLPATPPPAYRGRSTVRRMPVYCPRALRSRPDSFVANNSARPATGGSGSAIIVTANPSSELDVVGKSVQSVGRGVTAVSSVKLESPSLSVSRSSDDRHVTQVECHVASCSTNDS